MQVCPKEAPSVAKETFVDRLLASAFPSCNFTSEPTDSLGHCCQSGFNLTHQKKVLTKSYLSLLPLCFY